MGNYAPPSSHRRPRQKKKVYPNPEGYYDTPGWIRKNEHTAVCDVCKLKGNKNDQNPIKEAPCNKQICWNCETDPTKVDAKGLDPVKNHHAWCHQCDFWWKKHGHDEKFIRSQTGIPPPEDEVGMKREKKRPASASLPGLGYSDTESEDVKPLRKRRSYASDPPIPQPVSGPITGFSGPHFSGPVPTVDPSTEFLIVRHLPMGALNSFVWDKFDAVRNELGHGGMPAARYMSIRMRETCNNVDTLLDQWEHENGISSSMIRRPHEDPTYSAAPFGTPPHPPYGRFPEPHEQIRREWAPSPAQYQRVDQRSLVRQDAAESLAVMRSREPRREIVPPARGFRPINQPSSTPHSPSVYMPAAPMASNRPTAPIPGTRYAAYGPRLGEAPRAFGASDLVHSRGTSMLPLPKQRASLPTRSFTDVTHERSQHLAHSPGPAVMNPPLRRQASVVSLDSAPSPDKPAEEHAATRSDKENHKESHLTSKNGEPTNGKPNAQTTA